MTTRAKHDIHKPVSHLNLLNQNDSYPPGSYLHALDDPHYLATLKEEEYDALMENKMWTLVPRPKGVYNVGSLRIFKKKHNVNSYLSRYKARLVAKGKNQSPKIDCDETFILVVKPATIRHVLILVVSQC